MTMMDVLKKKVAAGGLNQTARELGLSKTTVSLVLNGKYGAATDKIMAKVEAIYGHSGLVACPHLNCDISPAVCADTYQRAVTIGTRATGNPETLHHYRACQKCPRRN